MSSAPAPPPFEALPPPAIARKAADAGVTKADTPLQTLFALSVLAGAFIALGAAFSTTVLAGEGLPYGVGRLLGGLAFSLGLVLVVVPSHAFGDTLRALAPLRPPQAGVAWAAKGFEPGSGRFLHEVAAEVLGEDVPLAVVTGPSFEIPPLAIVGHQGQRSFIALGRFFG